MGSLNSVQLIGRLGKDPEARQSANGNTVVNLSLATSEKFKDSSGDWQERTEWHRCIAFGKRGDAMAQYLKKGSQVYIEGSLQTRKWEDKEGQIRYSTEIVVKTFEFLDSKQDTPQESHASVDDESSIPF